MTAEHFLSQFADPDPEFGPTPAWWWSGDKLEWPRMRWQMDQMYAMGIRRLVIINLAPGGTLFGSEPDDPPFLSEAWWGFFEKTCDYAAAKGMKLFFYDQIGFSGANFQADLVAAHPRFAAEQLRRVRVEGTGSLTIDCPGAGTPLAAYVVPASDPSLISYVPLDGRRAVVNVSEHAALSLVYSVRQGFDLLNPAACDALLDTVHRQFERRLPKHIGTTIIGSFQDELPELPTWGATCAETFKQAYGYDLVCAIHRLFEAGDDTSRVTRVHYHAHRATLAEKAFFKPYFDWHESHGLICGFDQQSPAREARVLGCTQKYADYTRVHQWYGAPGCDLHGNGKLHSSIALLHDRKRVWLEGFHSTGWGGTIADTFDWLTPYLRAGSNLYNPHAIYYSTHKGWWEWAPPSTCWRQPYAMHYPPFADTVARLCNLLTQGVHQSSVGVLFPTATVQSAVGPLDTFAGAKEADVTLHETIGSMRWHQEKIGPLDEIAVDFHVLDEPAIASAEAGDGTLSVKGVPLRAVVLPHVTMLGDATAERLVAFARGGGKVVAVGSKSATTLGGKKVVFAELPNGVCVEKAEQLKDVLRDTPRPVKSPLPILHRRAGDVDLIFLPAVNGMATVVKWPGWFEPMQHTTIVHEKYASCADLTLPADVAEVVAFDPTDGSTKPLPIEQGDDGVRLRVDYDGAPYVVLACSRTKPAAPPSTLPKPRRVIELGDEWTCSYLPTLPTEFVDTHDPARPELRVPHTTEFRWAEGDADHRGGLPEDAAKVLAGFGVRAWQSVGGGPREPVVWSPEFGIAQDPLHINTLGPKSHVPEEFVRLGKIPANTPATLHLIVTSASARDAVLVVASNATKSATVNGTPAGSCGDAYQWMAPVRLRAGENAIDLTFTTEKEQTIRLSWCLVDPAKAHLSARPERIQSADSPVFGGRLRFSRSIHSDRAIAGGTVKVSVAAMAAVYVNDTLLGRQGGCDPYRPMMRGNYYDLPPLPAGEHTVTVELLDPGNRAAVMIDLLARDGAGGEIKLMSDATWTVTRDDGSPRPVQVNLRPEADNAAWMLYRRPHPLPGSAWIEGDQTAGGVLDLPLAPPAERPRTQWLEWVIPPGATSMRVPLANGVEATLWVDGEETQIPAVVGLQGGAARRAVMKCVSRELGGGLLTGPVTYELAEGVLRTGSWLGQGLRSYSGAIVQRQRFDVDRVEKDATIDLGRVRGTVEAKLNGTSLGVRFMQPYRFATRGLLRPGANELELTVTNTLLNHLSTWSPSRWWSPDQLECGVAGPVRLIVSSTRDGS